MKSDFSGHSSPIGAKPAPAEESRRDLSERLDVGRRLRCLGYIHVKRCLMLLFGWICLERCNSTSGFLTTRYVGVPEILENTSKLVTTGGDQFPILGPDLWDVSDDVMLTK